MKIKRIELKAFGPFSDRVLDFSSACPGVHVIYGPNEAGKSSCLRALHALFFGFPTRTDDNFIHPYDQLLVGGCLQGNDGNEVTFYRRKKRKADLCDPNDNPLDPSVLNTFLNGMNQALFESLYGIDHLALQRGGQEILDQKGNVGQAIFSAGAGLSSLRTVLESLEKEGDNLYRPRASTRTINIALSEHRNIQSQLKQALLSTREWREHRDALKGAEKELEKINALRREKDREKRRLERLRRALPYLGQRSDLIEKLNALGEVSILPADFKTRRRELEQERRDTLNLIETAEARINYLKTEKERTTFQKELIDRADTVEDLHQRVGEYRKDMADRPKLEGMRIACRADAAALLKQIRSDLQLEDVDTLRPGLLKRKTVQDLGNRHEALVQSVDQANREIRKHEKDFEKTKKDLSELSSLPDPQPLAQAVTLAQRAGDLDAQLSEKGHALETVIIECKEAIKRMGLWQGTLQEVGSIKVPLAESIDRFETEFDRLNEARRNIQSEQERLKKELDEYSAQFQEIQYAGDVPTEDELIGVRTRRDEGWQLLRRQWVDAEDVSEEAKAYSPELSLPDAYEGLVGISDQTADRLRREADRVQKHASLKARLESLETRLAELEKALEKSNDELTEAKHRWNELWGDCGISPLSPREMRSWISRFESLRSQVEESVNETAEITIKENQRKELRDSLIKQLKKTGDQKDFKGDELIPVLLHAETLLEDIRNNLAKREKLENTVDNLRRDLDIANSARDDASDKLEQWNSQWKEALLPLGLAPGVRIAEATEFMETLKGIFDKQKEADDFRKRIDGIDRDMSNYEKERIALLEEVSPDLMEIEPARAISTLQGRLREAHQHQAVLERHNTEIEGLEKEIISAKATLKNNQDQLSILTQTAGCEKEEELDEAERRSETHIQLKERLTEIEATLAQIAENVPLAELEKQAHSVDPDIIPGQIEALVREIDDTLDPDIQRLSEIIGQEKNEMARMTGSSYAAELADSSQQILARIRRLTEQFIRIRLSTHILREVIEQYRAEHQDPVLSLASKYFSELTLGAFTDLRTDIDDKDQAILIGIRPKGTRIRVEGMSSGTRDQLYLALRLASLEWRLESGNPLPFIVDDILINFDDERSQATLNALTGLSGKNQIILFTHHRRIVEIAKTMDADELVFIHEI